MRYAFPQLTITKSTALLCPDPKKILHVFGVPASQKPAFADVLFRYWLAEVLGGIGTHPVRGASSHGCERVCLEPPDRGQIHQTETATIAGVVLPCVPTNGSFMTDVLCLMLPALGNSLRTLLGVDFTFKERRQKD